MEVLLGKTLEELQAVAQEVGLPRFAGKQLAEWIYVRRATSFDEMTNISLKGREALKARYTIGRHAPVAEAVSKDGTKKYLFAIKGEEAMRREGDEARYIESVYIPDDDRATLCVSTQAGCKMGCRFCMTGTLGFHGHLSAAEILNQIFSIPDADKLTNIVYMGEGEPMDNLDNVLRSLNAMTSPWGCAWSPKRITVSSVGIAKGLKRFIEENECHLAISLHNPFAAERQQIMPIEKAQHLSDVIALLRQPLRRYRLHRLRCQRGLIYKGIFFIFIYIIKHFIKGCILIRMCRNIFYYHIYCIICHCGGIYNGGNTYGYDGNSQCFYVKASPFVAYSSAGFYACIA